MGVWLPNRQASRCAVHRRQGLGQCYLLYAVILALLLTACADAMRTPPSTAAPTTTLLADSDPDRGWQALQSYGCHTCHVIPGVPGAQAYVGPPLTAWAERGYIAGELPNTPENLFTFIQYPQSFRPGGAMPDMDVTAEDARDMSAYLYTLRDQSGWNVLTAFGW